MAGCVCDLHFSNAWRGMQGTQTTTNTLIRLNDGGWNETYTALIALQNRWAGVHSNDQPVTARATCSCK